MATRGTNSEHVAAGAGQGQRTSSSRQNLLPTQKGAPLDEAIFQFVLLVCSNARSPVVEENKNDSLLSTGSKEKRYED